VGPAPGDRPMMRHRPSCPDDVLWLSRGRAWALRECMRGNQKLSLVLLIAILALGASLAAASDASANQQGKKRNQSGKIKKDKKQDRKHGRVSARGDDDGRKLKKQGDVVVIDRDGHLRVVREFYARPG